MDEHFIEVRTRSLADDVDELERQRGELKDLRMQQAYLRVEHRGSAETSEEWKIWRRQPDGSTTSHGIFYHRDGIGAFLARPDRWIVRSRMVRTWRGPWTDMAEPPDVVDYLAECRDHSEDPEHDGGA